MKRSNKPVQKQMAEYNDSVWKSGSRDTSNARDVTQTNNMTSLPNSSTFVKNSAGQNHLISALPDTKDSIIESHNSEFNSFPNPNDPKHKSSIKQQIYGSSN